MKFRHVLLAVLVAAVWGANFVAVKWAVSDFPSLFANALRFLCVFAVFFPFLKIVPGRMKLLLLTAFMLGVVHFAFVFWGMRVSNGVGAVAIIAQLHVPFATVLAVVFLKETVGWKRVFGIALSFSGVLVLGFDPAIFAYWEGLVLIAIATFVFSVCAILMRQLKDVPVMTMQAWIGFVGMLGSLLLSLILEDGHFAATSNAGNKAWLGIIYSGLGSSVLGHGCANYLFKKYEVSVVSPYFLSMPIFALATGSVFLGEIITAKIIFGGLLTIAGILIVTLRNTNRANETINQIKTKA